MANYYLRYEILLLIMMEMHLGACQTCRNDIRDLFVSEAKGRNCYIRLVSLV